MKSKLTNKQVEDLLNIGYGIKTDENIVQIERDVLLSLVGKVYQLGFKKGQECQNQKLKTD